MTTRTFIDVRLYVDMELLTLEEIGTLTAEAAMTKIVDAQGRRVIEDFRIESFGFEREGATWSRRALPESG